MNPLKAIIVAPPWFLPQGEKTATPTFWVGEEVEVSLMEADGDCRVRVDEVDRAAFAWINRQCLRFVDEAPKEAPVTLFPPPPFHRGPDRFTGDGKNLGGPMCAPFAIWDEGDVSHQVTFSAPDKSQNGVDIISYSAYKRTR